MNSKNVHMNEAQISLALQLLEERESQLVDFGEPGDYSYEKIGQKVGVTGESIRRMDNRDMSPSARSERKLAQQRSSALLTVDEETIAAGWIVCHDMLRLDTSVETFCDFLRTYFLISNSSHEIIINSVTI